MLKYYSAFRRLTNIRCRKKYRKSLSFLYQGRRQKLYLLIIHAYVEISAEINYHPSKSLTQLN